MINYLLDPFIQIENNNGQPVVGAKIYVYYTGSRTVAPIYSDKEGTSLANPAITDTLGNVTIFAETGTFYDVLVYDSEDTLLFSKLNVTPSDSTAADVHEVDIEAGYGIQVHKRYLGNRAIYNVAIDPDETATQADVSAKQDKLTAGANIEITPNNTINVVQRKELRVQSPLKVDRSNDYLKLYLDTTFTENYKEKQNEVIIGGSSANYISKITQNENGNVSADVGNFVAGANINITKANSNLIVSGKDWTNEINSAVSGKIDKTPSAVGNANNPVYIDSNSDFQPCFSNTQTFMGWNNTFNSTLANHDNAMYGNGNNYNLTYTGNYQPSAYDNVIIGTNNSASLSNDSYLYDTCNIGSKNKFDLHAASQVQMVGDKNTISGISGGYINECGIFGEKNKIVIKQYTGDEYNSTFDNYIFGLSNSISGVGWGHSLFGAENETNAHSLSFMFGYRNKINDNQAFTAILFGENNNINATTAENKRLSKTCLVGFDNTINASNRDSDISDLYTFGKGNTISSGYQTFMYGYGNTASNVSGSLCFGKGLGAETNKIKLGTTNCYLEIDEIAGKIYKVINGTRTEI